MRRSEVPAVYPIADHDALGRISLATAVRELAQQGARWIQVRAKSLADRALLEQLEEACEVAHRQQAMIWVNDRPDLAALLPVAGVHLGQEDMPPGEARDLLGARVRIGRSTHTEEEFVAAAGDHNVDVIAWGPVFATVSKPDARPVVGLEMLERLRSLTEKPIIAIGGIDASRAARVRRAGADTVAVLGAVCRPPVGKNYQRLVQAVGAL